MKETIRFTLNDKPMEMTLDRERRLIWVLRTDIGLTGTKFGCGRGLCGSCTVLVNEQPLRSASI